MWANPNLPHTGHLLDLQTGLVQRAEALPLIKNVGLAAGRKAPLGFARRQGDEARVAAKKWRVFNRVSAGSLKGILGWMER